MSPALRVAFAATSARLLVEAARADGLEPIALDVFGDLDTRELAEWYPIGSAGTLAIDDAALLERLEGFARRSDVAGWVVGSGFESHPRLLEDGHARLPLLGNAPDTAALTRAPQRFYAHLAALGIAHAEVRAEPPAGEIGQWYYKDAQASGGWHVRAAARAPRRRGPGGYFQRRVEGAPMAALVLADGERWRLVGTTHQIVRAVGVKPCLYFGGLGPAALEPASLARLEAMLDRLVPALGLCGLNGIDFVLVDGEPVLIELNPRPTASLALLNPAVGGGLLRAHVEVCRGAPLPDLAPAAAEQGVRGQEVVFAPRALAVDRPLADTFCARPWLRDRPQPGTRIARHGPACTVVAAAATAEEVRATLAARRAEIERLLESGHD